MIQITRKSTLFVTLWTFLFVCSFQANSVFAGDTENKNINKDNLHNETISGLVIARSKIESAIDSYNKGDLASSRNDLNVAIEWLNKASQNSKTEKSIKESQVLSAEIDRLKKQLNQPTLENENTLMRYLHKTTIIIEREIDQLIHGYIDLSIAEKTLKHLLDAKMHLSYAKRNLLFDHEIQESTAELDKVIDYLDNAEQEATKHIQSRIVNLKKDISSLKNQVKRSKEAWKNNDEIIYLHHAIYNLNKVKEIATPDIKNRIVPIESEIISLRKDIESNNIKKNYDSCIAVLKDIINEL